MKRYPVIEGAEIQIFRNTDPGFISPGTALPGYLLVWVLEGTLHSVADGVDTHLTEGQMRFYPPEKWQIQYADTDATPHWVNLMILPGSVDLSPLTNQTLPITGDMNAMLSGILEEAQSDDPYAADMLLANLEVLLLTLLRRHSVSREHPVAIRGENEIICRAQQYVSAHVRDRLTVPLLALKTDVSPSYLTTLFRQHLGISPGEYIRRIKLQESKTLIREGNLNFTEIAALLNYSTIHHFSRQFKEKFGISPTEYAVSIR